VVGTARSNNNSYTKENIKVHKELKENDINKTQIVSREYILIVQSGHPKTK